MYAIRSYYARHDGAQRHPEGAGHVLVREFFEPDQQQDFTMLQGQLRQRAVEVAQFEAVQLRRALRDLGQLIGITVVDRVAQGLIQMSEVAVEEVGHKVV